MHELGIVRNIVAIVSDAAKGRRVRRVTLDVGKLSGVMVDAIAFCFEPVAQGTALEGAPLEIRQIEGRARCRACGVEFANETLFTPCAWYRVDVGNGRLVDGHRGAAGCVGALVDLGQSRNPGRRWHHHDWNRYPDHLRDSIVLV